MIEPQVLAVGMSEPAGASGVEADLRAVVDAGGQGTAVVTALAIEASGASRLISPLTAKDLRALMRCAERRRLAAVKIGFLPHEQLVGAAADELRDGPKLPVVADPVLAAPGFRAAERFLHAWCTELLPLVSVVTADVHEARDLVGEALDRHSLARALVEMGAGAVVLKGEVDTEGRIEDLIHDGKRWFAVRSEKPAAPVDGADAFFASTIAVRLARGEPVEQAAGHARQALVERGRHIAAASAPPAPVNANGAEPVAG